METERAGYSYLKDVHIVSQALPLSQILSRLDGQSYRGYREIKGSHRFAAGWKLYIDRVQSDPYAPPSQCRILMPQSIAQLPPELFANRSREIALRDYLTRQFDAAIGAIGKRKALQILRPGQAILDRSSCWVDSQQVEIRFRIQLPALGRRIAGKQAVKLICEDLPQVVARSLCYAALDPTAVSQHIQTAENADYLRAQLHPQGLVAFVADGAMLARQSGIDDRPQPQAIAFQSPASLRVTLKLADHTSITGMGIAAGITLIVGGGYHGKSTLLRAIERGIYNHIPGDGREAVVTDPQAVKIRAEDGRVVHDADLSAMINHLPLGRSSTQFSTENASGSTSQTANIVESIAAGAKVLLLDEDTCATNLMVRDARMQRLIVAENEPITPLIDKIQPLYQQYGVSTILVMGGCGDYLGVADRVIAMQDFLPRDVTAPAKAIVADLPNQRRTERNQEFGSLPHRAINPRLLTPEYPRKPHRGKIQVDRKIRFYEQEVDLSLVEQLIESGQLKTIAAAIVAIHQGWFDQALNFDQSLNPPRVCLKKLRQILETLLTKPQGLDQLTQARSGELVAVRSIELTAALNRLRHTIDPGNGDRD